MYYRFPQRLGSLSMALSVTICSINPTAVEIDYISQKVHLYRPDVYCVRKKSVAVPLHIEKGKAHIAAQLADITENIMPLICLSIQGRAKLFRFLVRIYLPLPRHIETYIGKGLNGDVLGRLGKIGGLTIEAFELPTMAACYPIRRH